MHKAIAHAVEKMMGDGEKKAPLKSLKLKAKFGKSEVEDRKKELAKKMK